MSFEQGLSGLNAASKSLDVIGNNIANANTVGFKSSGAQFSDVYANSLAGSSSTAVGIGTQLSTVSANFAQGNITTTNNPLDVAINGNGFYRMSDNGTISYSRDGQFHLDSSGYLVDSTGLNATGFAADSSGNIVPSAPVALQFNSGTIAAQDTSKITASLNLDAGSAVPASAIFKPIDPTSYNNSTSVPVTDSLGNSHVLSLYFVQASTPLAPNSWKVYASVDGTASANVNLGNGAGNPLVLNFNTSGALTTPMPFNVTLDLNGVATALGKTNGASPTLTASFDLNGSTQYGSAFAVNSMTQDGYASGQLSGVNVGPDGVIQGSYTNGQTKSLAQLVLVNFNNKQGLAPMGRGLWSETTQSGVPLVGVPGTGGLGVLQSSATEDSNVDLTAELVSMITMQREYQANAQSIKTQDSVLQTLVNMPV